VDPALRRHIRQLNPLDERVYQEAVQRFQEVARVHGVSLTSAQQAAA
jgi:hypothetical protein